MKADIERRFAANLDRVQHLMDIYQNAGSGMGRRPVETTDVLRSAVVFLHATLEDFLRTLLAWRLPQAEAAHLKEVPLAGKKPRSTFTLDELAVSGHHPARPLQRAAVQTWSDALRQFGEAVLGEL